MSKFWIRQNKSHALQQPFYELVDPEINEGRAATRTDEMASVAKEYYDGLQNDDRGDLEGTHEDAIRETLSGINVRLTGDQRNELGRALMMEDTLDAMMGAAAGKAAGLDGVPVELWQALMRKCNKDAKANKPTFNPAAVMKNVFNDIEMHGVHRGSLFAEGWICPIYKKGEKRQISNYRPITVLNADYKMFTKALTSKLAECAGHLIHTDQAGFVKGRKIHDNIKLSKLVMDYAEAEEIEGAIVALDQEKAYDKIDHDYLWAVLKKMNVPEEFIKTVQALYGAAESAVMVNGVVSARFRIV